jgi:hypothetical protein
LNKTYEELPVAWRVIVLKALMEWKFDKNNRVYDFCRKKYDGDKGRILPIGYDTLGNAYWYFGEEVGRLYVEEPPKVMEQKSSKIHGKSNKKASLETLSDGGSIVLEKKGSWYMLCSNIEEFKQTAEYLSSLNSEQEKELGEYISDNIVPNLEAYAFDKEKRKQEREAEEKAKAARKKEEDTFPGQEPFDEEEEMVLDDLGMEASDAAAAVKRGRGRPRKHFPEAQNEEVVKQEKEQDMLLSPEGAIDETPSRRALRPRKQRYIYRDAEEEDERKKDDDGEFIANLDEDDEDDYQIEEGEDEDDDEYTTPRRSSSTDGTKRGRGRPPKQMSSSQMPQTRFLNISNMQQFSSPYSNLMGFGAIPRETYFHIVRQLQLQQQMAQQMAQQMPQQMVQQIPQQMAQQIPQQMAQQIPQQMAQQIPQQMVQQIPQQISQQTASFTSLLQQTSGQPLLTNPIQLQQIVQQQQLIQQLCQQQVQQQRQQQQGRTNTGIFQSILEQNPPQQIPMANAVFGRQTTVQGFNQQLSSPQFQQNSFLGTQFNQFASPNNLIQQIQHQQLQPQLQSNPLFVNQMNVQQQTPALNFLQIQQQAQQQAQRQAQQQAQQQQVQQQQAQAQSQQTMHPILAQIQQNNSTAETQEEPNVDSFFNDNM